MHLVVLVRFRHVTVYAAIAANFVIAISKFVAAGMTHSAAMISEGIHSVVDSGDGLLLLLGLHLSHRPATEQHPYGRGVEVYFWSMVVAMVVFAIGGGVSIFQGVHHLISPIHPNVSVWAWGVLGFAFVFEAASWFISMHGFRKECGTGPVWQGIRASKDPTTFSILLEDTAALIGIAIAAAGLGLAAHYGVPAFDATASILIGVVLCVVAAILGHETWSLVVGESAASEMIESIERITRAQAGVVDMRRPRTLQLGPDHVHVDLEVRLDPSHHDVVATTRHIEDAICHEHPLVKHVMIRFPEWSPA